MNKKTEIIKLSLFYNTTTMEHLGQLFADMVFGFNRVGCCIRVLYNQTLILLIKEESKCMTVPIDAPPRQHRDGAFEERLGHDTKFMSITSRDCGIS